ncbi:maleylpyruvate isomerase family mycothiol-dependent enzyme [Streptantibioticus rubrisoli]|uniref:Maleylpyruvate isomerase family mycothiol-dependent enzyme n=1 Tax=Streptantibioticus rubrisoli TaxID=1387313 RepID=A0ABT1PB03_9ACTN|nr:maleylpyruvate isomerase family mycothiol-dependent enzyme [Streptantibioticus rubrisoli]MCQ4041490.1 maleylpyruvate isomerase family mycothiol-dependent enzyme [Streptantibioticus rubrisoli]
MSTVRDLTHAERLLLAERTSLLVPLRALPEGELDRPTVCTGWSVRDVIAHCGAALMGLTAGPAYRATHEQNRLDVEERRGWPVRDVLDEFERGLTEAAPAIRAAGGAKDLAALGTWVHGGDVRAALGWEGAYRSEGADDAVELLARCERVVRTPQVHATLPDRTLVLGSPVADRPPARLTADVAALVRLYTGRPVAADSYRLIGARPAELVSAEW